VLFSRCTTATRLRAGVDDDDGDDDGDEILPRGRARHARDARSELYTVPTGARSPTPHRSTIDTVLLLSSPLSLSLSRSHGVHTVLQYSLCSLGVRSRSRSQSAHPHHGRSARSDRLYAPLGVLEAAITVAATTTATAATISTTIATTSTTSPLRAVSRDTNAKCAARTYSVSGAGPRCSGIFAHL